MLLITKLSLVIFVFVICYHATFSKDCPLKYQAIEGHSACASRSPKFVSGGVTEEEKRIIIEEHNKYRATVNPPACDMRKMYWDDDLAYTAQKRANMCNNQHDKVKERIIPDKFITGQNLIIYSTDWKNTIKGWLREVSSFTYNKNYTSVFGVGHYTQIVWASTYTVGCGLALCDGVPISICNYGPSGNVISMLGRPYKTCAKRAPLLDCKGKICKSNADMEEGTCNCKCPKRAQIYGPECDVDCSIKDEAFCDKYSDDYCRSTYYSTFICPKKCKACPYIDKAYVGTGDTLKNFSLLQMFSLLMSTIL